KPQTSRPALRYLLARSAASQSYWDRCRCCCVRVSRSARALASERCSRVSLRLKALRARCGRRWTLKFESAYGSGGSAASAAERSTFDAAAGPASSPAEPCESDAGAVEALKAPAVAALRADFAA